MDLVLEADHHGVRRLGRGQLPGEHVLHHAAEADDVARQVAPHRGDRLPLPGAASRGGRGRPAGAGAAPRTRSASPDNPAGRAITHGEEAVFLVAAELQEVPLRARIEIVSSRTSDTRILVRLLRDGRVRPRCPEIAMATMSIAMNASESERRSAILGRFIVFFPPDPSPLPPHRGGSPPPSILSAKPAAAGAAADEVVQQSVHIEDQREPAVAEDRGAGDAPGAAEEPAERLDDRPALAVERSTTRPAWPLVGHHHHAPRAGAGPERAKRSRSRTYGSARPCT